MSLLKSDLHTPSPPFGGTPPNLRGEHSYMLTIKLLSCELFEVTIGNQRVFHSKLSP